MNAWFITPFFLHLIDWGYDECYHAARFEKETRYYEIRLNKDLLEDWVITLINGRIKSKLGQSRTVAFNHFSEGLRHFCALAKLRHQRGYRLKTITCDNHLILHLLPYLIYSKEKNELLDDQTIKKINQRERKKTKAAPILTNPPPQASSRQLGFSF